jgi:hypothetical protein
VAAEDAALPAVVVQVVIAHLFLVNHPAAVGLLNQHYL